MQPIASDYAMLLADAHTYQFAHPEEKDAQGRPRVVTVTAGRCAWGGVWLLYEQVAGALKLRYWVMPDGGIAHAFPGAAVVHQRGAATLTVQPPLLGVHDLDDVTDGMDPYLRKQINRLLDELNAKE